MLVQIPKALEYLFSPARYKVAYGGRGGSKSWSFVRALLLRAWQQKTRILCTREIQDSIKQSVHQLIRDQIVALGMTGFFEVKDKSIVGANGSEFQFEGLRYNVDSIRSKEGIDICAVFEAKNVSKASWEVLIPTIRKEGSEIWIEFNPELDSDETYKRFVKNPPREAIVRKISWRDNPWFPQVLKGELEDLKERDEDAYLNVWEGHCRVTLDGAIYANELRKAQAEHRICHVPYVEDVPVNTFWDLGFSDCTSILFVQKVGLEYHVIDSYQDRLKKLPHYLQVIQNRGYVYGTHYLPHDADHEMLGAKSIKRQIEGAGYKVMTMERPKRKQLGINAVRTMFNRLYIDETKAADALQAWRHYRYEVDEHGQWSREPLHDENSHYADALQTLGQSIGVVQGLKSKEPEIAAPVFNVNQDVIWMAS